MFILSQQKLFALNLCGKLVRGMKVCVKFGVKGQMVSMLLVSVDGSINFFFDLINAVQIVIFVCHVGIVYEKRLELDLKKKDKRLGSPMMSE